MPENESVVESANETISEPMDVHEEEEEAEGSSPESDKKND